MPGTHRKACPLIRICSIATSREADLVVRAGAGMIGLVSEMTGGQLDLKKAGSLLSQAQQAFSRGKT